MQKVKMSDQEETSCQVFEDKLKEGIQRLLTDGIIAKILQLKLLPFQLETPKRETVLLLH